MARFRRIPASNAINDLKRQGRKTRQSLFRQELIQDLKSVEPIEKPSII